MNVFDEVLTDAADRPYPLAQHRGQVLLIVNVASGCGFAPQLRDLARLRTSYAAEGLVVLACSSNDFRQEARRGDELESHVCARYGVNFPVLGLTHVRGADAHPLFTRLTRDTGGWLGEVVRWNFEKFLVGRDGTVKGRWRTPTSPLSARVRRAIEAELRASGPA